MANNSLSALQISAFSEAELDRYLEDHEGFVIVEDPENLPDRLHPRLSVRLHGRNDSLEPEQPAVGIHSTRLGPHLHAISGPAMGERLREALQHEADCWQKLVKDGGRPAYPLTVLNAIARDSRAHREDATFWRRIMGNSDLGWRVFSNQLARWEQFRVVQQFARAHKFLDEPMLFAVAKRRALFLSMQAAKDKDPHASIDKDSMEEYCQLADLPYNVPGTDKFGFANYAAAMKRRLTAYGFTQEFVLNRDPAQQDQLTTWIEYLGYEFWYYDMPAIYALRCQQSHDEAWSDLVSSGMLRSVDTEEFICSMDAAFQEACEREDAEATVNSARLALACARRAVSRTPRDLSTVPRAHQRMWEAHFHLDQAMRELESIKRRNNLISEFRLRAQNFRTAVGDAELHGTLLLWMMRQVSMIETELQYPIAAERAHDADLDGRWLCFDDAAGQQNGGQHTPTPAPARGEHQPTFDPMSDIPSAPTPAPEREHTQQRTDNRPRSPSPDGGTKRGADDEASDEQPPPSPRRVRGNTTTTIRTRRAI